MKSIQLPDDVYERAAELAEADKVSVDKLVAAIVNERTRDWSRLKDRAANGSLDKLQRVLSKVRDVPVDAIDRL
jgi:predicted DNA-binding ribbon-helix-helix protein